MREKKSIENKQNIANNAAYAADKNLWQIYAYMPHADFLTCRVAINSIWLCFELAYI